MVWPCTRFDAMYAKMCEMINEENRQREAAQRAQQRR